MVLSYIYVIYFSINLCGGEDSVDNYQTYCISCSAVMVFESYGILFFFIRFVAHISISHDFHAQLCFCSHFNFTAHTSLGCRNV